MANTLRADPRTAHASCTEAGARPCLDDLMERAFLIVAVARPPHPRRSRVEWLVGGHERAAYAVDVLLGRGMLAEIGREEDDRRLMLGPTVTGRRPDASTAASASNFIVCGDR